MKKTIITALTVLMIFALGSCSELFGPSPALISFTGPSSTVEEDESFALTVSASTMNIGESDFYDYEGTISIWNGATQLGSDWTFDSTGEHTFYVSIPDDGTYTLTARIETADGAADTATLSVTVVDPPAPVVTGPTVISEGALPATSTWYRSSIDYDGDVDEFTFSANSSFYVIHWADSLDYITDSDDYLDVKVTVLNGTTVLEGPVDSGCWEDGGSYSDYDSGNGIRISMSDNDYNSGDTITVKVQSYWSTGTGDYDIYVY